MRPAESGPRPSGCSCTWELGGRLQEARQVLPKMWMRWRRGLSVSVRLCSAWITGSARPRPPSLGWLAHWVISALQPVESSGVMRGQPSDQFCLTNVPRVIVGRSISSSFGIAIVRCTSAQRVGFRGVVSFPKDQAERIVTGHQTCSVGCGQNPSSAGAV